MRLRPLPALLPLVLLSGAALTGCGGLGEDFDPGLEPGAEGITAVIEITAGAIADGDGPRACSLMARTAQEEVMQRSGVTSNCLDAITAISEPLSDEARTALADVQVTDIDGEETTSASATTRRCSPTPTRSSSMWRTRTAPRRCVTRAAPRGSPKVSSTRIARS